MAADPLRIARAVASRFEDAALLHSGFGGVEGREGVSYVAGGADAVSHALDPHEPDDGTRTPASQWGDVPHWIGCIPYESRRSLEREGWRHDDRRPAPAMAAPEWRRYGAVLRIDPGRDEVVAIGEAGPLEALVSAAMQDPVAMQARCALDDVPEADAHRRRVRRAKELILDGDLYQVNLARRFGFAFEGHPVALYERMTRPGPCRFGAVMPLSQATVVSLSPELLLRTEVDAHRFVALCTEPIKGTRPRGEGDAEDRALAEELDADPKERAELAMIIDVERHDLGRVCEVGSVRIETPPRVVTHRTVHHREARLVGRVREDASRMEVLEAMVPSGSVTGAPKVRAMEVIAELEAERRGLYTGGMGYVARNGAMTLAMAIRTLVLRGDRGSYWSGGGIVADSDPERELLETEWKARRLLDLT